MQIKMSENFRISENFNLDQPRLLQIASYKPETI